MAREPMPMDSSGPCWICGGTTLDRVWRDPFDLSSEARFGPQHAHGEHPPTWIVRCRDCGFGQPESMPARADYFDTLYAIPWSEEFIDREFDRGFKDTIFAETLAGLGRRLAPGLPRTLLDIGTWFGRFPYLASRAGWQAEAIEINPLMADYSARRTGLPVRAARAQDLADEGRRYGAVTMIDVLEHIPRPAPLVAELRRLLLPGGVLAIKVPHGPAQRLKERMRPWLTGRPSDGVATRYVHVNHFGVSSLRRCLEAAGFRDVQIVPGAPEFEPRPSGAASALSGLFRRAVYRAAHLPGMARTPLAMNLQAYAINPGDA